MTSRKTKFENADTPAMVKPGKRGLRSTSPYDAAINNGWPANLRFGRNRFTDRPIMVSFKFNFTLTPVFLPIFSLLSIPCRLERRQMIKLGGWRHEMANKMY